MNETIKTIMKRDGLTEQEARQEFDETRAAMMEALAAGDTNEVEDILLYDLGLEMDYIFDFLF